MVKRSSRKTRRSTKKYSSKKSPKKQTSLKKQSYVRAHVVNPRGIVVGSPRKGWYPVEVTATVRTTDVKKLKSLKKSPQVVAMVNAQATKPSETIKANTKVKTPVLGRPDGSLYIYDPETAKKNAAAIQKHLKNVAVGQNRDNFDRLYPLTVPRNMRSSAPLMNTPAPFAPFVSGSAPNTYAAYTRKNSPKATVVPPPRASAPRIVSNKSKKSSKSKSKPKTPLQAGPGYVRRMANYLNNIIGNHNG